MRRTLVEAIAERHVVDGPAGRPPRAGDLVTQSPARTMSHDNTSAIMKRFRELGGTRLAHPSRVVVVLDHDIQNRSAANLSKYAAIEAFAREQGAAFHPAGSGIGHQVMVERLHVAPGQLAVAADSHATTYGAIGALGVPVARSDVAGIWATGLFWWEIPETVRVVLAGRLPRGATGKDLILTLCALYPDDAVGRAVEIDGPGLASLTMDDRLTVANMTSEWGAVACAIPADALTRRFLEERRSALGAPTPSLGGGDPPRADADAAYAATIEVDLERVAPHVSGPDTLERSIPVTELEREGIAIDKAYLVSCANARLSDLEAAAEILRGHRIADGISLYVAAASADVQLAAEASGAWGAILGAGASPLPSGCGPCIGLGDGLLRPGETGVSASNRNFKGRMGSSQARCYLASPAVVAASALAGRIRGIDTAPGAPLERRITFHDVRIERDASSPLLPYGRASLSGRAVLALRDAIDTDALCPARLVYDDAASPEALAAAVFESFAPGFSGSIRRGDVLVAGARFGIGSSREQAARALIALGIAAVVAASIAPVFRRNALNHGLIALEAPDLVARLRDRHPEAVARPTIAAEPVAIEFERLTIRVGETASPFRPLPEIAVRLVEAGGLDGFLRRRMGAEPA